MSLPRYPEYKASGVEWLGEVPGHWKMRSLRYAATIQNGSDFKDCEVAEGGYPVLGSGGEFARISKFIYDQPSVLLGRKGTIDNPLYIEEPFWTVDTLFYTKLATDTHPKFFYWFCTSIPFDYFQFGSAVPSMTQNDLYGIKLPTPSFEEQQTIAAFLDRETGKIDALIAEQRRLMELLAEKRQAVISHAVTKGLNPNAPMKDSGIEWLGEVPAYWEVKRIRFVAELNPSKSEVATLDKEMLVSFLPMDAIGDDGTLNLEREKPIAEVETGYTYFRDGDVTVAKITPCFENGKGAVMRGLTQGIGFGTTELIVARPIATQTNSGYLHSLFTSVVFRKNGEGHMYGAGGQKRVPDDFVRNFEIAFPPLKEQQIIVNFLDTETAKFDVLTAAASRAIALLQERRSALISAAVTGKIDVRGES